MRRPLHPDEIKIWTMVAATVRARPGRTVPTIGPARVFPADLTMAQAMALDPLLVPQKPGKAAKVSDTAISPPPAPAAPLKTPKSFVVLGSHAPGAHPTGPHAIEPRRKQRLARERDPITARLDLHGMDQDRAKAVLEAFLWRAQDDGLRAVLVITGKGFLGDGILRRRAPDWLSSPSLRPVVAGVSESHRRHGGEGALYVALKKKPAL